MKHKKLMEAPHDDSFALRGMKLNKSFDRTFSKGGRRPQPMRVPEIQSQTGLTKKLVFCASFHWVLKKVRLPGGPPAASNFIVVIILAIVLVLSQPVQLKSYYTVIPVFDFLKYIQDILSHNEKMIQLAKIIKTVRAIKKLENETRDFFRNIYSVIKGSDLISAKDLCGRY